VNTPSEQIQVLVAEAFVRDLLWSDHPECCGSPVVGAEYMGQQEMVCCGCPEPMPLNDAQIVASLRAKFPEAPAEPVKVHDWPACAMFRGGKCTCD
jgi:hypothetical protein